jgi:hypothetical protein
MAPRRVLGFARAAAKPFRTSSSRPEAEALDVHLEGWNGLGDFLSVIGEAAKIGNHQR